MDELEFTLYKVSRKEVVLQQDTRCNHLYVLLKGELEVNIIDVAGNLVKVEEIIAPRAFATPHLFGENNILPATFTVSKDSILLMATRTSVFKLISSVPQLLHSFLCVTGNCNKCTVTRLRILSYKNLRSRFVYYLMEHLPRLSKTFLFFQPCNIGLQTSQKCNNRIIVIHFYPQFYSFTGKGYKQISSPPQKIQQGK